MWGWQAVAVGSIGRKTLLLGGYMALGVTQMLLTIALYMQVILQPQDNTMQLREMGAEGNLNVCCRQASAG